MRGVRLGLVVENDVPFVFEEARALRALGVDVRVASVFRPEPPARWRGRFDGPVAYPDRGAAAWVRAALPGGVRSPARAAALARRARAEGAPLRLVALAAALAERARREGWTHLHASFAGFPAFVAAGAAGLADLPWSFTGHAYDVQEPRPWVPRLLRETRFARAISSETARRLAALAPEVAGCVRVGHLGVDVARFAPPARPPAGPPRIVAVANPGPTKGLDVLVDAVAELARTHPDVELVMWGEGPWRAALEARIAARGLGGRARLAGAAGRDAVAAALRGATLFALPCVTLARPSRDRSDGSVPSGRPDGSVRAGRHDGLPVAILEAMATGLPVVSTDVSGAREAIGPGSVVAPDAPSPGDASSPDADS
ncbi:MAG: glycosyltransferase family 4 protein, partial [Myxococcota bacterium]|nr:glycosyltransferase family 4 protein [Myxococcota bacterium]